MATLKLSDSAIAKYFGFLKNMDARSKKKLITQLTESIEKETETKSGIDHLFGAWEDDRTTEELISDIAKSRTTNKEIEDFE